MHSSIHCIDSHVHLAYPISFDSLSAILQKAESDSVCLLALPGTSRLDPTPDLLCYKLLHPDTTFVFGCLDCTVYETDPEHCGLHFIQHAKRLFAIGCDGIKLLEGKPTMRRQFPIPDFDSPAWDPFWAFAEQKRIPLLWHVNDPEQFWHPDAIPVYAKGAGWGYGPNDINNEEQYRQVRSVLERHPLLNVTFAHLFFLSAQLPRLSEWLDRFPNMRVDLTPGIELYENLSRTPDETHAFFVRYGDRIQYGTDIGGRAVLTETATALKDQESLRRVEIIRSFLHGKEETQILEDGQYLVKTQPFVLRGMAFGPDLLQKIERDNFFTFIGASLPRRVRKVPLLVYLFQLKRKLLRRASRSGLQPDLRAVRYGRTFLLQHLFSSCKS